MTDCQCYKAGWPPGGSRELRFSVTHLKPVGFQVFLTSFNQVFTFVLVQSGTSKPTKLRKDGEEAMDATSQADGATLSEERWVWLCWISWILQILLKSKQTNLSSSSARLKEFKSSLFAVFQSAHAQSVKMKTLMDDINKGREQHFSEAEVRDALAHMQDHNQIMLSDDIIFLIWAQTAERNRMDSLFCHIHVLFSLHTCHVAIKSSTDVTSIQL